MGTMGSIPNINCGVNCFDSPSFFPSQIFQASKQGVPSITSKPANTKMPSDACMMTHRIHVWSVYLPTVWLMFNDKNMLNVRYIPFPWTRYGPHILHQTTELNWFWDPEVDLRIDPQKFQLSLRPENTGLQVGSPETPPIRNEITPKKPICHAISFGIKIMIPEKQLVTGPTL